MIAAVALPLFVAASVTVSAGGDAVAVVLLPLVPEGTVTTTQARGVSAQLRAAITVGAFASALKEQSGDDKVASRCGREAKCLAAIADERGADLAIGGILTAAEDGLRVAVVVVAPKSDAVLRRADATLKGDARDAARIDRLVRVAIAPDALRGSLVVTGDAGATVELDGASVGVLPLAPIDDVREGDHVVVVKQLGFRDDRRNVAVSHGETTTLKAVLLATSSASGASGASGDNASSTDGGAGLGTDVIVLSTIGGALLALGVAAGTWSLLDGLAVEARAAEQQLFFPRDTGLLLRGQILAYTADGLYLAGAATLGAGVALAIVATPNADDDALAPRMAGPTAAPRTASPTTGAP